MLLSFLQNRFLFSRVKFCIYSFSLLHESYSPLMAAHMMSHYSSSTTDALRKLLIMIPIFGFFSFHKTADYTMFLVCPTKPLPTSTAVLAGGAIAIDHCLPPSTTPSTSPPLTEGVARPQGRSHAVLPWCTGTRVHQKFVSKFTNTHHVI